MRAVGETFSALFFAILYILSQLGGKYAYFYQMGKNMLNCSEERCIFFPNPFLPFFDFLHQLLSEIKTILLLCLNFIHTLTFPYYLLLIFRLPARLDGAEDGHRSAGRGAGERLQEAVHADVISHVISHII